MKKVGVEALLEVKGANRAAKSYAFLYAAFKNDERSDSPVKDAVDCLRPFIVAYLKQITGKQVDLTVLQQYLKNTFDFEIPIYALQQILPALVNLGHIEYRKNAGIYISKSKGDEFSVSREEIETDFDFLTERLTAYANSLGVTVVPSGDWGQALINFLKTREPDEAPKVANIKGAILNPQQVETSVVGAFIQDTFAKEPVHFDMILRIFMGVLIEEFISTISEIGDHAALKSLNVFFDTSVLMRVLGCSGGLQRVAAEELTRYLQDMGINLYFFSGNEAEVQGILDALVTAKNMGGELWGESADAISRNEIKISDIRLLQTTMAMGLATKGIFPANNLELNTPDQKRYQIDEKGFADFLSNEASRRGKPYSYTNRTNDAGFLGNVMRLRKGIKTRDFAESKAIFITTNNLLAKSARRFLLKEKEIGRYDCPPVLTERQAATIAWLMKDRKLEPTLARRELLTNCYAAYRPDADWFQNFKDGIEKVVGDFDAFISQPANNLKLQAARNIALQETFGNATLMRTLNIAEVLQRAGEEAEIEKAKIREEEIAKAEAAVREAKVSTVADVLLRRRNRDELRALNFAKKTTTGIRIFAAIFFFVSAIFYEKSALFGGESIVIALLQLVFTISFLVAALDLAGVPVAKNIFSNIQSHLQKMFFSLFHGDDPE